MRPSSASRTVGLAILALLTLASTSACRNRIRSGPCQGLTREQCAWQEGQEQAAKRPQGELSQGPEASAPEDRELGLSASDLLERMAELMAAGMEADLVEEEAKRWCESLPTAQPRSHGPAWTCNLKEESELGGRALSLEAGGGGVIALTTIGVLGPESEALVKLAQNRWRAWCQQDTFAAISGDPHHEFHRCTLAGGPMLVIGRFPRDLEADLWQVSLAVMAAG